MKICNVCKKEVPDDSLFCQYCGSKDVIDKVEQNAVLCEDNKRKPFSFKTLILVSLLFLSLVYNFYMANQANQLSELKKEYESMSDARDAYRSDYYSEHSKYIKLIDYIKDIKSYDGFYINESVLSYPNNEKVLVTFEHINACKIYSESSSSVVSAKWGNWIDDDTCELFITCNATGIYYIDITNSENDQIVKVVIINE